MGHSVCVFRFLRLDLTVWGIGVTRPLWFSKPRSFLSLYLDPYLSADAFVTLCLLGANIGPETGWVPGES